VEDCLDSRKGDTWMYVELSRYIIGRKLQQTFGAAIQRKISSIGQHSNLSSVVTKRYAMLLDLIRVDLCAPRLPEHRLLDQQIIHATAVALSKSENLKS
jgi:hypothetical protein